MKLPKVSILGQSLMQCGISARINKKGKQEAPKVEFVCLPSCGDDRNKKFTLRMSMIVFESSMMVS